MSVGLDHVLVCEGVGRNLAQRRLARETQAAGRLRSGVVLIPGGGAGEGGHEPARTARASPGSHC